MSQPTVIEDQRDELHRILSEIKGIVKVYYQPPSSEKLKYPCLIYGLEGYDTRYASNRRYLSMPRYQLTLIDYNPESIIHKHLLDLNNANGCYVKFNRYFTSDNLNHWAYDLYFSKKLW